MQSHIFLSIPYLVYITHELLVAMIHKTWSHMVCQCHGYTLQTNVKSLIINDCDLTDSSLNVRTW